jgi:hypothetical protein
MNAADAASPAAWFPARGWTVDDPRLAALRRQRPSRPVPDRAMPLGHAAPGIRAGKGSRGGSPRSELLWFQPTNKAQGFWFTEAIDF